MSQFFLAVLDQIQDEAFDEIKIAYDFPGDEGTVL